MIQKAPLDGRCAIVTGASAGIGRETSKALARDGANVVIVARREERLRNLSKEIENEYGTQTLVEKADVRNEGSVERVIESALGEFGQIDILVNNAGIVRVSESIEEISTEDYKAMMETNVDGMFYATKYAIPHIRESNGNIIFVGSDSGQHPEPELTVYGATKWWTRGFAANVEAREGRNGIAVTLINPGDTRTEIEYKGQLYKDVYGPGEASEPEDIAEAISFAARQKDRCNASTIDLYQRDLISATYESLLDRDSDEL